ncbi:hypothetical protein GGI12_003404 [Dipsacomyces acuminosporus]|nr:hypothetical protein GGI12_003404 [Dipsacomyces acuminosporus]
MSVKYEVFIDNGSNQALSRYTIDKINIHPSFNPTTLANNIAVIQFNKAEKPAWQSPIGILPDEWDDHYYVSRTLVDIVSKKWRPLVVNAQLKDSDGCSEASELYKNNRNALFCTSSSAPSIYYKVCKQPYSSVYAVMQPNGLGIGALYSHTSSYNSRICESAKQFHYYTILANYNGWARSILGYDVSGVSHSNKPFNPPKDYAMKDAPTSSDDTDITIFSGNIYPYQVYVWFDAFASATATKHKSSLEPSGSLDEDSSSYSISDAMYPSGSPSAPASAPTSGSAPDAAASSVSHKSSSDKLGNGLTRTAVIAMAVALPIGTLLITVALFFLYRWWRSRKATLAWDPSSQRNSYNAIYSANGGGAAMNRESRPPPYETTPPEQRRARTSEMKS